MVPSSIAIDHEGSGDVIWITGSGGNWRWLAAKKQTSFSDASRYVITVEL
jgi:hypothetical protein